MKIRTPIISSETKYDDKDLNYRSPGKVLSYQSMDVEAELGKFGSKLKPKTQMLKDRPNKLGNKDFITASREKAEKRRENKRI